METDDLIYLVSCAVDEIAPDAERVKTMDLDALYKLASRHSLCAITAYALEAAGVHDPRFIRAKAHAASRSAQMDMEMEAVLSELEAAGIWYMPLKGAVMQHLYPLFGMRETNDRDILIDETRAADVKTIMEGRGFSVLEYKRSNHDHYIKEPVCSFEMHRALIPNQEEGDALRAAYYRHIKARLIKDEENGFGYHFTPEDFYVFLIVHAYKHYLTYGIKLRDLLDVFVYLKKLPLNWDDMAAELEKMKLSDFENSLRSLALHLFGGDELTDGDRKMLDYVLARGVEDKKRREIENKVLLSGGRLRFFFMKLTYPNELLMERYPNLQKVVKKMPFLYPFISLPRFVYRLLRGRLPVSRLWSALRFKGK